jgi:hypothetical protein
MSVWSGFELDQLAAKLCLPRSLLFPVRVADDLCRKRYTGHSVSTKSCCDDFKTMACDSTMLVSAADASKMHRATAERLKGVPLS